MTQFLISSAHSPGMRYNVNAFIVSQITGNQPVRAVSLNQNCKHIQGLSLADPEYNKPGKIDILLGVDIFNEVIHHGWWSGPHNTHTALNTEFRWVLAGSTGAQNNTQLVSTHFTSIMTGDDLLCQFWKVEEKIVANCTLTPEERCALDHFNSYHSQDKEGRFIVLLHGNQTWRITVSGSSQFLSFERSIHSKGVFPEVQKAVQV